jgi:aerobic-type carbon monoxide dehydrogenase small subunit (CoxS/CutS family)
MTLLDTLRDELALTGPKKSCDRAAYGACTNISRFQINPCLYQIYANASRLVSDATQLNGSLNEATSVRKPYNGPQSVAGF